MKPLRAHWLRPGDEVRLDDGAVRRVIRSHKLGTQVVVVLDDNVALLLPEEQDVNARRMEAS